MITLILAGLYTSISTCGASSSTTFDKLGTIYACRTCWTASSSIAFDELSTILIRQLLRAWQPYNRLLVPSLGSVLYYYVLDALVTNYLRWAQHYISLLQLLRAGQPRRHRLPSIGSALYMFTSITSCIHSMKATTCWTAPSSANFVGLSTLYYVHTSITACWTVLSSSTVDGLSITYFYSYYYLLDSPIINYLQWAQHYICIIFWQCAGQPYH